MPVTREIEPLGDHLGADHDVGLAALDLAQQSFRTAGAADGILIPAQDSRRREEPAHLTLDALRSRPEIIEWSTAGGQAPRRLAVVAAMTDELPILVIDEGNIAIRTLQHRATGAAENDGRQPAPVEEQNGLLLRRNVPANNSCSGTLNSDVLPRCSSRRMSTTSTEELQGSAFARPVGCQQLRSDALRQREQADVALPGSPEGLDGGCRAAQDQHRAHRLRKCSATDRAW